MQSIPKHPRLSADTTAEICALLAAQIGVGLNDRQAVLTSAFGGGSPIPQIIDCNGTPAVFAAHLVEKLLSYGTTEDSVTKRQSPALAILLRSLAETVGIDVAARLNRLAETVEAAVRQSAEGGDRPPPTAQKWVDNAPLPKPKAGAPLVFLCHGKEDKAYVKLLYRRLVRDGYYPWLDEVELKPYDLWEQEIYAAIARSERFIVCLSSNTTGERFFQKEIANALTIAEKRGSQRGSETPYILPIRWDNCDIPEQFSNRNVTSIFPCDPKTQTLYETGYANLLRALPEAVVHASPVFSRGYHHHNLKEYDKAIAECTEAIRLDPKDAFTYNNRGLTYYHLKQYDKAIADFNKVIWLDPKVAIAYFNRGNVYNNLKRYYMAIDDYNEAIRLNPKYASAYFNRGRAYGSLKRYDTAIADFNKAILLDPKYVNAYYNRGLACNYLKQYDKAIADYEKYLELKPDADDAAATRAKIAELRKKL